MTHQPIFDWEIGVEKEAAPGYYAMLLSEVDGWRVWRFEFGREAYFVAGKPAEGQPPLIPLGAGKSLFGQTPFLVVTIGNDVLHRTCEFKGRHSYARSEFRAAGDRFFAHVEYGDKLLAFDGRRIEVNVRSQPTERSFTKGIVETAIFDMTGLVATVDALKAHVSKGS